MKWLRQRPKVTVAAGPDAAAVAAAVGAVMAVVGQVVQAVAAVGGRTMAAATGKVTANAEGGGR